VQNTLDTYADPTIGELAVGDVDTALVPSRARADLGDQARDGKPGPRAHRTHPRLREGEGLSAGENPARWRGHLDKLLPSALNRKNRKHHAALPYDEIGASWARCARRRVRLRGRWSSRS